MVLHNFIVFEGIDGAGTSTQLAILKNKIPTEKAFFSAEPTTHETGKFLRRILSGEIPVHPKTAAYLFAADRCEHIYGKDGIQEKASSGILCFSDRYFFSSLAYQSQECGEELPNMLNSHFPLPEILFYFTIDPSVSLKRIIGRETTEIYEKEDFLRKTERAYKAVMEDFRKKAPEMKIIEVDATLPVEKVSEIIDSTLKQQGLIS
ncbi:MAG: dTMP kinase [Treponemataceae bacterium]|nr:dTMP kinase [Treponemataceae bacterium]